MGRTRLEFVFRHFIDTFMVQNNKTLRDKLKSLKLIIFLAMLLQCVVIMCTI